MTPEELAAFKSNLPNWEGVPLIVETALRDGFKWGLSHARAEAAKEIAHIRQCEENFAIRVLGQEKYGNSPCQAHPLELVELEIASLKTQIESQNKTIAELEEQRDLDYPAYRAQVEGLRPDAERLDWLENSTEEHGFCHIKYGEFRYYAHQRSGFPTVRESIDAAIAQEKPNDR